MRSADLNKRGQGPPAADPATTSTTRSGELSTRNVCGPRRNGKRPRIVVNDPVGGVDVKRGFRENQTPHERAQTAADVRRGALPDPDEHCLPEALRRSSTAPLNSRTGRRPTE